MNPIEVGERMCTRPAGKRRSIVLSSDRIGTRVSSLSIVLSCLNDARNVAHEGENSAVDAVSHAGTRVCETPLRTDIDATAEDSSGNGPRVVRRAFRELVVLRSNPVVASST
jgi:hypothetical protein